VGDPPGERLESRGPQASERSEITLLIPAERIHQRLDQLAQEIRRDFSGKDLVLVGVLRASFIFLADLVRRLDLPLRLDFVSAASYGDGTTPQRPPVVEGGSAGDICGRDCLLVDAVLDTGRTLSAARRHLLGFWPRSLAVCVLLVKEGAQEVELPVEYVGFTVPDRFLVGYGLDYAQRYRNLPHIAALDQ
jgi:hypoxanthine phosphoribosyltransferase